MNPKEQGASAFQCEDKPRRANPYDQGSDAHRQWDSGYCAAFLREYGTGQEPYEEFWK